MNDRDKLEAMLELHLDLQRGYPDYPGGPNSGQWDPAVIDWARVKRTGFLTLEDQAILYDRIGVMCTALTQEVAELRDWTPWKHWSRNSGNKQLTPEKMGSEEHVREMRMEVIDALHFFFNLILWLGMDAQSLHDLYVEKNYVNRERRASGRY